MLNDEDKTWLMERMKETSERLESKLLAEFRTPAGELLDVLDRIEQHSDEIFVRYNSRNIALPNLPAAVAIQFVCAMLRRRLCQ